MISYLEVKDCKKMMEYLNNSDSNQYYTKKLFSEYRILRQYTFESRMIHIADVESGKIKKLFSVITPVIESESATVTIIASYNDYNFIKESIQMIKDVIENENYKKIKIQLTTDISNIEDIMHSFIKCGFVSDFTESKKFGFIQLSLLI